VSSEASDEVRSEVSRAWPTVSASPEALACVPRARACIGMGGNLGEVRVRLQSALRGLNALPATAVLAVSSAYQTAPVDATGPDYLNAVAVLESALGPQELLAALLALELTHDRERPYHHAPRTLDLDLLWYDDATRATPSLSLPHPRMTGRAFVLEPLAEVLASWPPSGSVTHSRQPALPAADVRAALRQSQGVRRLDGHLWPLA